MPGAPPGRKRTGRSDPQRGTIEPPVHPAGPGAAPPPADPVPPVRGAVRLPDQRRRWRALDPAGLHAARTRRAGTHGARRHGRHLPSLRGSALRAPGGGHPLSVACPRSVVNSLCGGFIMHRRQFLQFAGAGAAAGLARAQAAPPPFQGEKSKLKITGVRLVKTRPKRPLPTYQPAPGSWSTGGVEVANPMSIYPKYKAMRSLFMPDAGKLGGFTVEISTDQPAPGSWSTGGVEVANPMSIYPKYKAMRSLFMPDAGKLGGFTVEISTDKGVKGYGSGG